MNILSIHDGHNASAAVLKNGVVESCVSEERLNRKKFYWGFPTQALEFVLTDSGLSLSDIDVVTVSHLDAAGYLKRKFELGGINGFISYRPKITLGNMLNIYQVFRRERDIRRLFHSLPKKPEFFFLDHHTAHAASAYFHSGFDKALVVTLDGLGDSLSHTAWVVEGVSWKKIVQGDTGESLGAFYEHVTKGLGFTPNRHEGKVVGLAAYADPEIVAPHSAPDPVTVSEDGLHFHRGTSKELQKWVAALCARFTREEVASYAQHLLEERVVSHVSALMDRTGVRKVAVAGGVFANVKMNQRIVERCQPEQLFVEPAMGDEGLVLGSALYYHHVKCEKKKDSSRLPHVYFGTHASDEAVRAYLEANKILYQEEKDTAERVGVLLQEGKVVGWFDGRMEFGPRALGHRSILARPTDHTINDSLNKKLRRSEFMPFAPSVLYEHADSLFENVEPSRHAAEFMTVTYSVRPEWRAKIAAVTHVDGTARPQLVRREVNPAYYDVIAAYHRHTGIPCVVNTSFNMHEEPIVSSVDDALRSCTTGAIDFLVINNRFIVSPKN